MKKTRLENFDIDVLPTGFFAMRTPLLPFDELVRWSEGTKATEECRIDENGTAPALKQRWTADLAILRARLLQIADRKEILQAIFVASPSLGQGIVHWKNDPDSKKGLQAERALVRYFARMSSRPTPFGLFAGSSLGRIGSETENTDLSIKERQHYVLNSRLDFEYLCRLTDGLTEDTELARELRYRPNSSLHRIGEVWHYMKSGTTRSGRSRHLIKLYSDKYLEAVLGFAQSGATISSLAEALRCRSGFSDIEEHEAEQYVRELVADKILVGPLAPLVTGKAPLDELIDQLAEVSAGVKLSATLIRVREQLNELDQKGLGASAANYAEISSSMESLPFNVDVESFLQVDMIKPLQNGVLATSVIGELKQSLEVLCRIGRAGDQEELRVFRKKFTERYQEAWVPLIDALDEDSGLDLGYASGADGSPLTRRLGINHRRGQTHPLAEDFETLLRSKVLGSVQKWEHELNLDIADLPSGESAIRKLPDAFSLVFTLSASSIGELEQGNYEIYLKNGVGPSGATLLGRFCHADSELTRHVRDHLREEQSFEENSVYAELVYLPDERLGNVTCRPVLREYEICYLGRSGAPEEKQISVNDLLVTVTREGRIILQSQRLKRRVIPRLSTAHMFNDPRCAAIYRFLCRLQNENGRMVPVFSWGSLDTLPFLPRLRVGRTVLSRARWRISAAELKEIALSDRCDCFYALQRLRRRIALPRWILFTSGDQNFPVDLDNVMSVDALVHILRRVTEAVFSEVYPPPESLCVSSIEGHFCHELVVPFVRARRENSTVSEILTAPLNAAESVNVSPLLRNIPPGGEWLYLRVFGGSSALDDVLVSTLPLLLETAKARALVSQWFFVRFADPQNHLRIRFKGDPNRMPGEMLTLISGTFQSDLNGGRIRNIEFGTYSREIERYGGFNGTLLAEKIFWADSESVLDVLRILESDHGLDMRWRAAVLGIDRLLRDFEFSLSQRRDLMEQLRDGFRREFKADVALNRKLGNRFREERHSLGDWLSDSAPNELINRVQSAFEVRTNRAAAAITQLRLLNEARQLTTSLHELVASFLHMHVNRLIRGAPRVHELALYDFLFRIYKTLALKMQ